MLVLRRKAGEALMIGADIEIEFLEITSQVVKIGIKAPRTVSILRKELQITACENRAAALGADLSKLTASIEKSGRLVHSLAAAPEE